MVVVKQQLTYQCNNNKKLGCSISQRKVLNFLTLFFLRAHTIKNSWMLFFCIKFFLCCC
jgi:hypothetical protein